MFCCMASHVLNFGCRRQTPFCCFFLLQIQQTLTSLHYICSLILHEGNRGLRGDLEELSVKRQILSIGQKNSFRPKLFFGTNSSIPLLWLSSEKWIEGLLLRNIDLFFQGHFQCFGEKANFDHLDKFAFLDSSCRKKYFFVA